MTSSARHEYEAWHAGLAADAAADAPWHAMVRRALDPARDLRDRRVLEAACGRGGFAAWMSRHPERPRVIVAADLALAAVVKGRGLAGAAGVRWCLADVQRLPFGPGAFDTVFSFETLEHVPAPRAGLSELVRVLRPGGRLFLSTPNYFNVSGLYRVYLKLCGRRFSEAGQPINHPLLLPRTHAWVRGAGLRVLHVETWGHFVPTWPGRAARRLEWPDRLGVARRWLGQQALVVAERPSG